MALTRTVTRRGYRCACVASSTWGEVRSTQDIDLVVVATRTALVQLCKALPPERWYDLETGWKVDVIR